MVWIIILAVIFLILIIPLGVDASYSDGGFTLSAKAGSLLFRLLPKAKKEPTEAQREKARLKAEKKKQKKAEKKAAKQAKAQQKKEQTAEVPKKKPDLDLYLGLARAAIRALDRFRIHLSFDLISVRAVFGGEPYSVAMNYGRVNAIFSSIPQLVQNVLNVRRWELSADCDFCSEKTTLSARLILTIQLWEVFYVAFALGFEALICLIKSRRKKRLNERKLENAKPAQ